MELNDSARPWNQQVPEIHLCLLPQGWDTTLPHPAFCGNSGGSNADPHACEAGLPIQQHSLKELLGFQE